jgi:hypothetical protein
LTRKKRWVALPFTDDVGPLGTAQAVLELVPALDALRARDGVRSAEVRFDAPGGRARSHGVTHVLQLGPGPDELMRSFSKSRVRQIISRAARDGVRVRVSETERDLMETFFRLHLMTRRRLGVPVQPRRFFELLWERFVSAGLGSTLIAEAASGPAAAAVFLQWNGTTIYKFSASDPESTVVGATHAILWEAIRGACLAGMQDFQFGRTDAENEGLRAFKAGWGADERSLVYTTLGQTAPAQSPGRMTAMLSSAIRHSPPWVCKFVGERLYRFAA